jgi:methionyl-tRNA synthetase
MRRSNQVSGGKYYFRLNVHQQWLVEYIEKTLDLWNLITRNEVLGFLRITSWKISA